jgi:MoxR-like ATPase
MHERDQLMRNLENLKGNLTGIIKGKDSVIELLIIALAAGGNVLMEDVPGVGTTTLAKTLARSIDGIFNRVQFTPDLLPADIIGCSIYNPREGSFYFRNGPIFANILLADEINRASPRTQSALLEAMSEHQVSIEGQPHILPNPFMVIATENPIEYHGTYPLPEAQLDRFAMQLSLGYPEAGDELNILFDRKEHDPADDIKPVLNCMQIINIQEAVKKIDIEISVAEYTLKLIRATRADNRIMLGASPRALLILSRCCQARAFIHGRGYVLPDDVKLLAPAVLPHRIVLDNKSKFSGISSSSVIAEIIAKIKVPV